ncbi:MAG: hypothetical protein HYZ48_03860, partial [Chlamydiales bacterium]|nr:hypothetical protein [Chlamydiales bacterium]
MKEFRKRLWLEVALCSSIFHIINSPLAYTLDPQEHTDLIAATNPNANAEISQNLYTINFNNISIIELIRFVSKITNLNFVFEEGDLQFSVTVVSEEPLSAKNVMSALAQVLRVHDLTLLEQENNILIIKNASVNQIPSIISEEIPESQAGNAALVTQVFRIRNANLNSVASIIRPLTSKSALIEVSNETRQLIVTDITTNVEKIASLLLSLDSPHTPLDVELYTVKNISPTELIALTQQILTPFAEGNPLLFVPQVETNAIYIVSTPYLIERSMMIMEDLDIPPRQVVIGQKAGPGKNVFIYQAINRSPDDLLNALRQVNRELKSSPGGETRVETAIDNATAVKDSNSIMFIADPETVTALKEMLASLDTPVIGKQGAFYIYKIQQGNEGQITSSLSQMKSHLKDAAFPDQDLINAINNMRYIKETNSLVFTGTQTALDQLKSVLPTFDIAPTAVEAAPKGGFYIYKIQQGNQKQMAESLNQMKSHLRDAAFPDQDLIDAINNMRYIKETDSFIFTGNQAALDQLATILPTFDIAPTAVEAAPKGGFYIYKIQQGNQKQMAESLNQMKSHLKDAAFPDQDLIDAINNMRYI